ncbi:MAG: hypothetical protein IPN67_05250 [Bacteroidales bacterium]|nr:hypothetical protein [Bacteroidales bacterium]
MKIKYLYHLIILILFDLYLSGCTKAYDKIEDPEKEIFNFVLTEAQEQHINASRGEQYEVTDPIPILHFGGSAYQLDRFEIRGDNTLKFYRKGFGVNMDRKISMYNPLERKEKKYEEFKLLAMVYDYTYIENSTAVGLFRMAGLWPVYSFLQRSG